MFNRDVINTLAFGEVVLFVGHALRRLLPWLARDNVPAPVIGGLLVAAVMVTARSRGLEPVVFDTRLQAPMMIAFFTTIGFAASRSLLRGRGPQVLMLFLLGTVLAVLRNVVAEQWSHAERHGQRHAAPAFELAGVPGAASEAVAAEMVGIVSGGLIGGSVGTLLVVPMVGAFFIDFVNAITITGCLILWT
jgi:ESS family glutamate:Na+ symporter